MSRPNTGSTENPLDEAAFQAALTDLLGEAHEDGIDVDGNWACATNGSLPDWEIEVCKLSQ